MVSSSSQNAHFLQPVQFLLAKLSFIRISFLFRLWLDVAIWAWNHGIWNLGQKLCRLDALGIVAWKQKEIPSGPLACRNQPSSDSLLSPSESHGNRSSRTPSREKTKAHLLAPARPTRSSPSHGASAAHARFCPPSLPSPIPHHILPLPVLLRPHVVQHPAIRIVSPPPILDQAAGQRGRWTEWTAAGGERPTGLKQPPLPGSPQDRLLSIPLLFSALYFFLAIFVPRS
jgi:hypothetical protein